MLTCAGECDALARTVSYAATVINGVPLVLAGDLVFLL